MNKRERITSTLSAITRFMGGVTSKEVIESEIKGGFTGCVRDKEAEELVAKKKWTPELVEKAKELGLIVTKLYKDPSKNVHKTGGQRGNRVGGAGSVMKSFAEKFPQVFHGNKGESAVTPEQEQLCRDLITEIGVRAYFNVGHSVVREADSNFTASTYFSEKKEESAPAPAATSPEVPQAEQVTA